MNRIITHITLRLFVSEMIKIPENVIIEGGELKWSPVNCADGYNIHRDGRYFDTVVGQNSVSFALLSGWEQSEWTVSSWAKAEGSGQDIHSTRSYVAITEPVIVVPEPTSGGDIFSDHFDGTALDPAKWISEFIWGRSLIINNEQQFYVPQIEEPTNPFWHKPFSIEESILSIKARRAPETLVLPYTDQPWLSGKLCAKEWLYGEFFVEADIRCPFGAGVWPAFWLYTAEYTGDQPEADIMEQPGFRADTIYHNYHFLRADGFRFPPQEATSIVDSTQFNKYGLERKAGELTWFVNGMPKHRVTQNVTLQPMVMILNLAMGGNWPGPVPASLNEATMQVRSVDVWSL
jgi:hypothetical protein